MKKLQTNFVLNPSFLGGVEHQNIASEYCDWIGISIDMKTMALMPNVNLKVDGILSTLNLNMQTKK